MKCVATSPNSVWAATTGLSSRAMSWRTKRSWVCTGPPGFFFLMGAGMVLFADSRRKQGWSERAIVGHLMLRGALLVALQLLVANRAWELSPGGWRLEVYIGVLFALGASMMLGSLLLRLDWRILLLLSLGLLLGIELLTPDPGRWAESFSPLSRLLLVPGGSLELWTNYPILPWLELTTLGMVFGCWLVDDPHEAFRRGLWLGGAFLLAFFPLRYLDGLGNIRPRAGNTWIDFLNVVKYPPSITFTLLTTSVNLVLIGLFARAGEKLQRWLQPLVVFGQVPLFFYLVHLFVYAALGRLLALRGTSLPVMYLFWLLGLLVLYPPCLWYGRFRQRQPANSILRYF